MYLQVYAIYLHTNFLVYMYLKKLQYPVVKFALWYWRIILPTPHVTGLCICMQEYLQYLAKKLQQNPTDLHVDQCTCMSEMMVHQLCSQYTM